MIKSFKCPETQRLFETGKTKRWSAVQSVADIEIVDYH